MFAGVRALMESLSQRAACVARRGVAATALAVIGLVMTAETAALAGDHCDDDRGKGKGASSEGHDCRLSGTGDQCPLTYDGAVFSRSKSAG